MRILLLILAVMLLAAPASAINEWTNCNTSPASGAITPGKQMCFEFNQTWADNSITSFVVVAGSASACLVQDKGGSGATAEGTLYSCPTGTASTDACEDAVKVYSTGDCESVSTGLYMFQLTTISLAGEEPAFSVQGHSQ